MATVLASTTIVFAAGCDGTAAKQERLAPQAAGVPIRFDNVNRVVVLHPLASTRLSGRACGLTADRGVAAVLLGCDIYHDYVAGWRRPGRIDEWAVPCDTMLDGIAVTASTVAVICEEATISGNWPFSV